MRSHHGIFTRNRHGGALGVTLAWLLVGAVTVGCGASDDTPSQSGALARFALKSSDVPATYKQDENGNRSLEKCFDSPSQRAQRGLAECRYTNYSRHPKKGTYNTGLIALRYRSASAASATMASLREQTIGGIRPPGGWEISSKHSLPVSDLGDEAPRGFRIEFAFVGEPVGVSMGYLWRRGSVVLLFGSGAAPYEFDPHAQLEVARRIDARGQR